MAAITFPAADFSEESWRPVEADRQATTQFKKSAGHVAQRQ